MPDYDYQSDTRPFSQVIEDIGVKDDPRLYLGELVNAFGERGFGGIGHGFHEEGVGAAGEEGVRLGAERGGGELRGRVAERFEQAAEGAEVAEHPRAVAGDLAGQPRGRVVEFGHAPGDAVRFQHE